MPNYVIERAARLHVQHLRQAAETGCSVVSLSPDAYTLAPLVKAHAKALADLLEYYLDVEGGADGVAATRDFLITAASTLLVCEFDDADSVELPADSPLVADPRDVQTEAIVFEETDMRRAAESLIAEARDPAPKRKAVIPAPPAQHPLIIDLPDFSKMTPPEGSRRARRISPN